MRINRLALVFSFLCVLALGQQADVHLKVSQALQAMNSQNWEQRAKAFGELPDLEEVRKQRPDDVDRVKAGLIGLLSTENAAQREFERNGTTFATEDHSEYYASLIGTVADLNDERAIPALVGAVTSGGMATRALARFGDKAVEPVLQLSGTHSAGPLARSDALLAIKEMLQMEVPLSEASHARIKRTLGIALKDPEYLVRYSAICAIEYLKDRADFVPALKDVAEHDPGESVGTEHHSLRPAAEKLLQKIGNTEKPADQ